MTDKAKITMIGRIAFGLVVIGFGAMMSNFVLRPYLLSRSSLSDLNAGIGVILAGQRDMNTLSAELDESAPVGKRIETLLPHTINLDDFLTDLGEFGDAAEIRIDRLLPNNVETTDHYRKLNLNIQITGGFLNVYHFINQLEDVEQLARVEDVKLSNPQGTEYCIALLRLALYFAPEEQG